MSMDQIEVHGVDFMGSDLTVVNNARVSFDKESMWDPSTDRVDTLRPADKALIKFLARGLKASELDDLVEAIRDEGAYAFEYATTTAKVEELLRSYKKLPTHWAPFANGCQVQLHIKAPIPIMRQVFKHKVGAVESEISRRYVTSTPEVFIPEWRQAADDVKQGSRGDLADPSKMAITINDEAGNPVANVSLDFETLSVIATAYYEHLISQNVCAEQARFVLPQGTMTEARITNSLYGWAQFYNARSDVEHAQREVAYVAEQVRAYVEPLFPVSWKELTG